MEIGILFDRRYEIRGVKRGGLGVVYEAFDHDWKRMVAIKTFQNRDIFTSETKERFITESTNWINLGHHDNIVLAHYYKVIDNIPYLFLEYIDGPTFRTLVGSRYPLPAMVAHAIEICRALNHAYTNFRVIHRDIKPDNVFLTKERTGEFNIGKVADFGLSKVVVHNHFFQNREQVSRIQADAIKRTHGVLGTLLYVSPEQILAARDIDYRSDIYSLGVTLFELATGTPPFLPIHDAKDIRPQEALLEQHLKRAPIPPRRIDHSIPRALNNVILKCLEKRRERRFSDYGELVNELSRIYKDIRTDDVKTSADFYEAVLIPEHSPMVLLSNRACSYAEMGNYEEALAIFEQILQQYPHDKLTLCNKALSLSKLGRYEEAATLYERALDVDSTDAETWAMLGDVFNRSQHYDDAVVCYDNAIRLAPTESKYLKDKAYLMTCLGCFEDALRLFTRVAEVTPDDYEAWHEMAVACERLGSAWEAVRFYRKALEINKSYAYSLDNLGCLLCQLGQVDQGIRSLYEALEIDAQNPKTWNNLGIAYVHGEQIERARLCFEKAIQIAPNYQRAKINLEALDGQRGTANNYDTGIE